MQCNFPRRSAKDATWIIGAKRLLRHLYCHGIPIGLAKSSGESMVEIKITNHRETRFIKMPDGPLGVRAALSAGMQVVIVPDQPVPKKLYEGATIVFKSLQDFKPEYYVLPPFPSI
ncbi:PREDICTED: probable pseudouridine-5'-phosphatase [Rhagoletis zephyria]|uniref:probable pseudouridine-5'-phosphatase n=1 Tax=Rhagoletis zephyria TaxID=28612 RepID=UPI0008114E42|nr:PREDICTED: probable pseudouridine-5'-phosphatase [Rhagoletis zephyria]